MATALASTRPDADTITAYAELAGESIAAALEHAPVARLALEPGDSTRYEIVIVGSSDQPPPGYVGTAGVGAVRPPAVELVVAVTNLGLVAAWDGRPVDNWRANEMFGHEHTAFVLGTVLNSIAAELV